RRMKSRRLCVRMARPSAAAKASCSGSGDCTRRATGVVRTSCPSRRSSSTTGNGKSSSAYSRAMRSRPRRPWRQTIERRLIGRRLERLTELLVVQAEPAAALDQLRRDVAAVVLDHRRLVAPEAALDLVGVAGRVEPGGGEIGRLQLRI